MPSWPEISRSLSLGAVILVWKSDLGGRVLPSTIQFSEELQDFNCRSAALHSAGSRFPESVQTFPKLNLLRRMTWKGTDALPIFLSALKLEMKSGETAQSL